MNQIKISGLDSYKTGVYFRIYLCSVDCEFYSYQKKTLLFNKPNN